MVYIIEKAPMRPVERYASIGSLILMGVACALAGYLLGDAKLAAVMVSVVAALGVILHPGDRLEYRVEADGIRIGRQFLPFRSMRGIRIARLDGTFITGGVAFPGFWYGKAWSRQLGSFFLYGSTGLGKGVLITLTDGRRVMITPARPVSVVVQLQVTTTARRYKR